MRWDAYLTTKQNCFKQIIQSFDLFVEHQLQLVQICIKNE